MNELTHQLAAAAVPYTFPKAWRYITMFLFFGSFAFAMGGGFLYSLVVRPALNARSEQVRDNEVLRKRSASVLVWAGVIFLISLYPQLAGKVTRANKKGMTFSQGLHPSAVWAYVDAPAKGPGIPQGPVVLLQFSMWGLGALLLIALAVPAVRARISAVAWTSAIIILIANFILSIAGDLGSMTAYDWLNSMTSEFHVLFTCTWIGGLMNLALLGLVRGRLSPAAGPTWHHIWKRFSRVAQICVGGLLVTGLWMAWDALGTVPMLWHTPFGRFLLLKLVLVLTLILIGVYNEYVLLPKLAQARANGDERGLFALAAAHFPRVVVTEALLGTAVLLIVPFLTGGTGREEGGIAPTQVTGGVFAGTAILIAFVVISFLANAKVQGGFERRAAQEAPAPAQTDTVTSA